MYNWQMPRIPWLTILGQMMYHPYWLQNHKHIKGECKANNGDKTEVSADLCPQLLGEYESLRREHEELKVNRKTLYISERVGFFLFDDHCNTLAPILSLSQFSIFLSTEQFRVNGEQAVWCQWPDIRTEEVRTNYMIIFAV